MEEVDRIILDSFINIGCEFADGLESVKQLTTENVVEATVKCLKVINPEIKISHVFPPGMSARFRVGSAIAQACQTVGYRDNIGYQTFLYSNETDIRKIFMFLVEKLPRKEGGKESEGTTSVLRRRIGKVLLEQCQKTWMPSYCSPTQKQFPFKTKNMFVSWHLKVNTDRENIPYIHQQVPNVEEFSPSVLELNANGIASHYADLSKKELASSKKPTKESFHWKEHCSMPDHITTSSCLDDVIRVLSGEASTTKQSRFANAKKLQFTKSEELPIRQSQSVEEKSRSKPSIPKKPDHLQNLNKSRSNSTNEAMQIRMEEEESKEILPEETEEERFTREEKELNEVIFKTENTQTKHKEELRSMQASIQQMKIEMDETANSSRELKENLELKKKTVYLLPNAEESTEKLKNLIEKNSQRLITLANLWEEKRLPMINEIRQLKKECSVTEYDAEKRLEEIKELRKRMKETNDETKRKEQMVKQLNSELESVKRDVSRQSYTKRILEIVSSIHRQQLEIERVISDMREAQKKMNQMKGRIDRTFTAVDEIMFKDAKKDESVRQAYKYLVALHDSCKNLIDTVEDTGAIMRAIRELENQIETETKKNAEENLQKIAKDYKEIKKENAEMLKRLKQN